MGLRQEPSTVFSEPVERLVPELEGATATGQNGRVGGELVFWGYKLRDGKRAIDLATEGCKVTDYKQAHLLSTLAAGHAETGDFKTAIEWSQKAVAAAPDEEMKANLVKELESYQANKPWRELLSEPPMPDEDAPAEKTANKPGDRK